MSYQSRRDYLRPYQAAYKRKRKQEYVDQRGGVCEKCTCSVDLEFHHREPHLKLYSGNGFFSLSRAKIEWELAKCDLLCKTCHAQTPTYCRPVVPVPRQTCQI